MPGVDVTDSAVVDAEVAVDMPSVDIRFDDVEDDDVDVAPCIACESGRTKATTE